MDKTIMYRYTATADSKPDNLYNSQKYGAKQPIWIYNDVLEALRDLPKFETTCERDGDKYLITCYALKREG